MPCNLAPDFYERASYETPARADNFLMSLDNTQVLAETGNVTSPLGHITLVNITRDMIAEYVSAAGDPWMSERRNFEPGWYIIRVRVRDGLMLGGLGYGEDCVFNEEGARADFAEAVTVHEDWEAQYRP